MKYSNQIEECYRLDIIKMNKRVTFLILLCAFILNGTFLFGQQTRIEVGDKYFDQFAFRKAIELYKTAVKRGHNDWETYAKLGDAYYNLSETSKAIEWYEKVLEVGKNKLRGHSLLKYALSLQSEGKDQDSVKMFLEKAGIDGDLAFRDYLNKTDGEPVNLDSINSKYSDFGTFIKDSIFYFSSTRENPSKARRHNNRKYQWNDQPYLDIYSATFHSTPDSLRLIHPDSSNLVEVNTYAHDASVSISSDGKTMYYAGGLVDAKKKPAYNKNGLSNLKIKSASYDPNNNQWIPLNALSGIKDFDLEYYSIGSPVLSPDNSKLFFVTCAPFNEAKGQTDIYFVEILGENKYGPITALEGGINTPGRETFPFFASDGSFYFSSDGIHDGQVSFGLLDIYRVENIEEVLDGKDARITHLPHPINSEKDDFAFYIDESENTESCEYTVYFSSNRPGGHGDDDIYKHTIKKTNIVSGKIFDAKDNFPLANARVELFDSDDKIIANTTTNNDGEYVFEVECGLSYVVHASAELHEDQNSVMKVSHEDENVELRLKPFPCEIIVHFKSDLDDINFDEKGDLIPVWELLITNRDLKIRIEAHTDYVGSDEYNLQLSQRRATSSKNYLIQQGVYESQIISAVGYGEKCLIVTEDQINKLPPIEELRDREREKNRRSRFILEGCNISSNCNERN